MTGLREINRSGNTSDGLPSRKNVNDNRPLRNQKRVTKPESPFETYIKTKLHMSNKYFIPLLSLICIACVSSINAQSIKNKLTGPKKQIGKTHKSANSARSRTTASKKLPLKAQDYYWDETSADWMENGHSEYTYDQRGDVLTLLSFDVNGNSTRGVYYTYNDQGKLVEELTKYFNGTEMVNSQKYSTSFDEQGNSTGTVSSSWQNGQWEISWGDNTVYTYDTGKRITAEVNQGYSSATNTWEDQWKYEYVYSGGGQAPVTIIEYERVGDQWEKASEYTNVVFSHFGQDKEWEIASASYVSYENGVVTETGRFTTTIDGDEQTEIMEIYVDEEWIQVFKSTIVTMPDGSIVTTSEGLEDDTWYLFRYTMYKDSKGEDAGYKNELYQDDAWIIESYYLISNTYNDNDEKVETITENYYSGDDMLYKQRQTFSDFISVDITTSYASFTTAFAELSLFPNPATDALSISNIPAESEISVINSGNQTVARATATETTASVSVTDLQPGVYFINIRALSGETKTLKFIKR